MIEGYEANKLVNHQIILILGPTPQELINLGFPQLPLAITGRVVDKTFFDHGVTKSMLEKAYSIIATPKAIYKSDSTADAMVLITYEIRGQDPLIVAIHPNQQLGGRKDYYNNIASMYYKSGNAEARWTLKGLLLWSR